MSKKKNPALRQPSKSGKQIEKPVVVEKRLTPLEMKELDLFQSRIETQNYVLENLMLREAALAHAYKGEVAVLAAKKMNTKNSLKLIAKEHRSFVAGIEEKLDVSLPDFTVQDDGLLVFDPINDPGEKEGTEK